MPSSIPSLPKVEEVVRVLRLKVSIYLGVVIVLACLGFMGVELISAHTHWQHLLLIFTVMVLGTGMIVPDFSLKFLTGAKDFLATILTLGKRNRKSEEPPQP